MKRNTRLVDALIKVLPIAAAAIVSAACSTIGVSDELPRACRQSWHRTETKRTEIHLRGSSGADSSTYYVEMHFESPQYYFVSRDGPFIVFMDPKDVVDIQSTNIDDSGPNSSARLLALIRADQPIEKNTDLNKYWVESYQNEDFSLNPRYVVATLLKEGRAAVFDTIRGEFIANMSLIEVYFDDLRGGRWEYCDGRIDSFPVLTVIGAYD